MTTASKRRPANPLALAVLACLGEKPMHPYEVAMTLRSRHRDDSIRLNYGALYGAVEGLCRSQLIQPEERERAGNRPERTVYRLTEAGKHELSDWLAELLSRPTKEYTAFGAGLSLIGVLPAPEAARLLAERCRQLEALIAADASVDALISGGGVARIHVLDREYRAQMLAAELAWLRSLVADLDAGTVGGGKRRRRERRRV
ncbi:MAG: PadR family transcriptional regulator [Bauldia sp.]